MLPPLCVGLGLRLFCRLDKAGVPGGLATGLANGLASAELSLAALSGDSPGGLAVGRPSLGPADDAIVSAGGACASLLTSAPM
jgi:hypothetical protein